MTEAAPGRLRPAVVGGISRDKRREVGLRPLATCRPSSGGFVRAPSKGLKSVVDRSTTGLNSGETDGLSVDRGAAQRTGPGCHGRTQTPCQGEGRGFESRLPLHRSRSGVVFQPTVFCRVKRSALFDDAGVTMHGEGADFEFADQVVTEITGLGGIAVASYTPWIARTRVGISTE